ncbi:HNH endonuclease [Candidatus Saccharibacteria bacterium]|nr:HNH endonuclease [Candidatus Saccharibacteria bacterium]
MAYEIPASTVERFRRRAAKELRPTLDEFEPTAVRLQRLRLMGLRAGFLVQLDWGNDVPHPALSLALLEESTNASEAFAWLMPKITIDEAQGCWALPIPYEHDDKGRARYAKLSSKEFDAKGELAHRFVVRRLLGSLATEEHLDHICRAHACCNPMHLEVVTLATNTRRGNAARNMSRGQSLLIAWQH